MKHDPTDYEPRFLRSRFCEIVSTGAAMLGSAVLGAGVSLLGGSKAAGAAEKAADTQVQAAEIAAGVSRNALAFQKEMYNVGRADLAPYRATGAGALQTMNAMFLPGGQPMVRMQERLNDLRAQRARLASGAATPAPAPAPAPQSSNALLSDAARITAGKAPTWSPKSAEWQAWNTNQR